MHKNPKQFSEQNSSKNRSPQSQLANPAQHVLSHANYRLPVFRTGGLGSSESVGSLLHALPCETLTNVTAWLDPPSLLALGLVDKYLKRYVDNDNIWQTAFLAHFLGVAPEEGTTNARMLLLRRLENTWKREYISRYKLLQCVMLSPIYGRRLTSPGRRWRRSKTTTTTHIPSVLPVTSMHLLNDRQSLVCFSADFGIAVRTLPATGPYCSFHAMAGLILMWTQAKYSKVGCYPSIPTLPALCGLDRLCAPSRRRVAPSSSHGVRSRERHSIPTYPKPWKSQIAVTDAPYAAAQMNSTKVSSTTSPGQSPELQRTSTSSPLVVTGA